jgi:glycosyltransferase involved in cell wall biosynthesis
MPLKVCQLCAVDFTLKHFLLPLVDGMAREGWQVTSVCSDGPFIADLRRNGYRIETCGISRGLNPFRHAWSLLRLALLMRRERFDVVHVHTPIAALLGRLAARANGVPMVVYTAHGFYFHERMRPSIRKVFEFLEKIGGRFTDLLFTQSAEDAASAVALGLLPAGRIIAIGNGVDPALFDPADVATRSAVRASLGIPAGAIVIGMIGRLVSEKGYREFFAAAADIGRMRPDACFVAVGDRLPSDHAGTVDRELERARALLGQRLVLTGLRPDVPRLLAAFDVFTLPSYREGMPRTIIEAMMTGLPVVATDIRGSREEVVAGETGLLVPARDAAALARALLELVDDAMARSRMGAAGRARALALYDESRIVAHQIAAIRSALPSRLQGRA